MSRSLFQTLTVPLCCYGFQTWSAGGIISRIKSFPKRGRRKVLRHSPLAVVPGRTAPRWAAGPAAPVCRPAPLPARPSLLCAPWAGRARALLPRRSWSLAVLSVAVLALSLLTNLCAWKSPWSAWQAGAGRPSAEPVPSARALWSRQSGVCCGVTAPGGLAHPWAGGTRRPRARAVRASTRVAYAPGAS